MSIHNSRREFLCLGGASGAALVFAASQTLAAPPAAAPAPKAKGKSEDEDDDELSPAEALMREHGVLIRVLVIYDEVARRLDGQKEVKPEPLADAARLVRSYIEDYHEKIEEDLLFPRFKKAGKLGDLIDVLATQHKVGRKLTDVTLQLASAQALRSAADRRRLADALRMYVRMFLPHIGREDTVLYPAFEELVTLNEYYSLNEEFDKREQKLFGQDGAAAIVGKLTAIEKALGVSDLAQFTPRVE